MMAAAEFARTRKIPYFGICYGFQWAVVEFARNVAGLTGADSTEVVENAPHKVIYKLRDLLGVDDMGGTMRLGSYACRLAPDSLAFKLYGEEIIHERHRHRYEFNCLYDKALTDARPAHRRPVARRQVRRDRRAARTPVVRRGAVPSRVQVEAAAPASAVRRIRRGRLQAQDDAWKASTHERDRRSADAPATGMTTDAAPDRCRCTKFPSRDGVVLGRPELVLIAGPVRHRKRGRTRSALGRAIADIARRAGVPYIFKASFDKANRTSLGVVSRTRDRRRPRRARPRARRGRRAGPDRYPRAVAGGCGGRGRRRAADSGVPLAPDRSDHRRGARPAGSSTSRRASSSRRSTCGMPSTRCTRRATTACSSPSAASRSATTTWSWTCARFR